MKQPEWERGCIQVYTGDGKGKTTAAFGLALRAAGAGLRVFIGQFIKGMHYSELDALERFLDLITVRQYGRGCFIRGEPSKEDRDAAVEGLSEVGRVIASGEYSIVILDEASVAVHFDLFGIDELIGTITPRPAGVEIIVTGRRAHPKLVDLADLVTEMREVKHYYAEGLQARRGIES